MYYVAIFPVRNSIKKKKHSHFSGVNNHEGGWGKLHSDRNYCSQILGKWQKGNDGNDNDDDDFSHFPQGNGV